MNTISKISVNGSVYDIIDTVTTINGKTGAISAADLNAILTAAGYKLTDENTVTSINGKTGAIAASDIALVLTSAGYKLTDTTYSDATTSTAGLMTAADKTKLNGITAGAQPHIAPTTAEVKSALGTGEGTTKYLREDGTWQPIDGEYQDLTAGNIVGTFSDESEVSFRPTAGAVDITSGKASKGAKLMAVKGNTVKWNQMAHNNFFHYQQTGFSYDDTNHLMTYVSDGTGCGRWPEFNSFHGHRYYTMYLYKSSQVSSATFSIWGYYFGRDEVTFNSTEWKKYSSIKYRNDDYSYAPWSFSNVENGVTYYVTYPIIIDLTLIYGEGNEPTTVEAFEADYQRWFGKPLTYEEYDAGSLRPVKMTGIKTVGFNLWDEEWEKGYYSVQNGAKENSDLSLRSKNKIPIFPNTNFHVEYPTGTSVNCIVVFFYGNKYIGYQYVGQTNTTPANCDSMAFTVGHYIDNIHSTYQNDICVHLSHSGARDGEYEPYWSSMLNVPVTTLKGKLNGEGSSVVVFPDGMKKAGNVYDEIVRRGDKTYAIKRIGAVDLGTLEWTYYGNIFYVEFSQAQLTKHNAICSLYQNWTDYYTFGSSDKSIYVGGYFANGINIKDSAYSDESTFRTAMSGVMLYYELATPEEYLLDDFELPQNYDVDDYGTEEVQLNEGCAPVLDLKYGINAGDTIKNLPHNYVSAVGEQSFTETQKARARKNIGINGIDNVPT